MKTEEEILKELESKHDSNSRKRVVCEICGTKDHVKYVMVLVNSPHGSFHTNRYRCPKHRNT